MNEKRKITISFANRTRTRVYCRSQCNGADRLFSERHPQQRAYAPVEFTSPDPSTTQSLLALQGRRIFPSAEEKRNCRKDYKDVEWPGLVFARSPHYSVGMVRFEGVKGYWGSMGTLRSLCIRGRTALQNYYTRLSEEVKMQYEDVKMEKLDSTEIKY